MSQKSLFFLYGPPFSGKSTLGRAFACSSNLPFWDVDNLIEEQSGKIIPQIFSEQEEAAFRNWEARILREVCQQPEGVVALGGGALLDSSIREMVEEQGKIFFLEAEPEALVERLKSDQNIRPLLGDTPESNLRQLLTARKNHYQSFPERISTQGRKIRELVSELETRTGAFYLTGMGEGYAVRIQRGGLVEVGAVIRGRGLSGPVVVISDENVSNYYSQRVLSSLQSAGYKTGLVVVPPGEGSKSIARLEALWQELINIGIERRSTIIALGGGVVGDLAGFAAATIFRGVNWVNIPTSLLAMVDAGIGGKTGVDLPQGKNLVGAFHAPALVWIDPEVLGTLPDTEQRNGMAEVIKHGMISDPTLWELAAQGPAVFLAQSNQILRRAVGVKVNVVRQDPFENHVRQCLNFGHSIGHAVEKVSNFALSHGEAVAVGMVTETYLSEKLGMAASGLTERLIQILDRWDLPTSIPIGLDTKRILSTLNQDKKKSQGKVRFALPVAVGKVKVGVIAEEAVLDAALEFGKRGRNA